MVLTNLLSQCNRGVWLASIIKSQTVPEKSSGSVKLADDKNFRQVVSNSGREAFILFYSPHCKHCNRLAPVWEELGEKGEAIDIVKIDGTVNNLATSEYTVTRFPTIYWKFADMSKRPVKYDGGRDLQDFIKYVSKHASQELRGWDRKGMPK